MNIIKLGLILILNMPLLALASYQHHDTTVVGKGDVLTLLRTNHVGDILVKGGILNVDGSNVYGDITIVENGTVDCINGSTVNRIIGLNSKDGSIVGMHCTVESSVETLGFGSVSFSQSSVNSMLLRDTKFIDIVTMDSVGDITVQNIPFKIINSSIILSNSVFDGKIKVDGVSEFISSLAIFNANYSVTATKFAADVDSRFFGDAHIESFSIGGVESTAVVQGSDFYQNLTVASDIDLFVFDSTINGDFTISHGFGDCEEVGNTVLGTQFGFCP